MTRGMNLSPVYMPQDAVDTGLVGPGDYLRVVLTLDWTETLQRYVDQAHDLGLRVLGVLARESFPDSVGLTGVLEHWAYNLPRLSALQVGNEPDHVSESSWTLTGCEVSQMIVAAHELTPFPLIGPGLVHGDPAYLDTMTVQARNYLEAFAVHCYGLRATPNTPAPAGDFGYVGKWIADVRKVTGNRKPVWVTEYGSNSDEVGEAAQAVYLAALDRKLAQYRAPRMIFCYTDAMVPGYGVLRDDGTFKPVVSRLARQ